MNVFILDDSVERQKQFAEIFPHAVVAYTADEAIEILNREKEFDLMLLDHDLGGRVYVDSTDENTGYRVARYIVDNDIKSRQIIIHTLNYVGAMNMISLLPNARYIPFNILVSSNLVGKWTLNP